MQYPQPISEYTAYQTQVQTVNNIFNGSDTAVTYLDKYARENEEVFKQRQKRATLNNYPKRTIETRKNIIFRKPIKVSTKNVQLEAILNNIDNAGTNFNEFLKQSLVKADRDGFTYALVDTPAYSEEIQSQADEANNNIRPYAVNIERKDLIYWRKDQFGNYTVIAFYESYEENVKDSKFEFEVKQQIKVLFNDGTVEIYRDNKLYETFTRGLRFITLAKLGESNTPLFYDMAKDTIIALNRESEKQQYLRTCLVAVPVKWEDNINDSGKDVIGLNNGYIFTDKSREDFQWREVSGNSYKIAKEELEEITKKVEMDSIKFATESNVKTATQVEKDATVDESKLSDRAKQVEDFANQIIEYISLLKTDINLTDDDYIEVNKDFSTNKLSYEQVDRLLTMYQTEVISYDRLMNELENGEILKVLSIDEREQEKTALLNSVGNELD